MQLQKRYYAPILATAVTAGLGYLIWKKYKIDQRKILLQKNPTIPCLTYEFAIKRKKQIQNNVDYKLYIVVDKGQSFKGMVKIEFYLDKNKDDVKLDFMGKNLFQIDINGRSLSSEDNFPLLYDGKFITLKQILLKQGKNTVYLKFSSDYAKNGQGLHSFIDLDSKQYLYTHCEPDYFQKIMPCFDQPDIKGCFQLNVIAPKDWIVIANEKCKDEYIDVTKFLQNNQEFESLFHHDMNQFKGYSFYQTKVLSTYLFAFVAGPFAKISQPQEFSNVEMNLYCRQSKLISLKDGQANNIFELTSKLIAFYQEFFGIDFPFSKYDQIFCPEYNIGAMENPGCVTINDKYIFVDKVSKQQQRITLEMVAHELAHMWFGDMVTMKWWNDLWLKESFADFACYHALMHIELSFETIDFRRSFNQRKKWGYTADQMPTTHSISSEVIDTEQAMNAFDGISYSKGMASIYQLYHLVGDQQMKCVLKSFFTKYQWSNSDLEDFTNCLEEKLLESNQNEIDIQKWKNDWICTPGHNSCEPIWDDSKLIIRQDSVNLQYQILRNHKMMIGLIDENGNVRKESITLKDEYQSINLDLLNIKGIFLNQDDQSFIKTKLDSKSIEFFKCNLHKVKDFLTRNMIYYSFYQMFTDMMVNNILYEQNAQIITDAFVYAQDCITNFTPKKYQNELNQLMTTLILKLIPKFSEEQYQELPFIENLIYFSENVQILQNHLIEGCASKLNINLYQQWLLVKKCIKMQCNYSNQQKIKMIQQQCDKDPSELKQGMRAVCEALIVRGSQRKKLWQSFLDINTKQSDKQIEHSMTGFIEQNDDIHEFHDAYFVVLNQVYVQRSLAYARQFTKLLFPQTEDHTYLIQKINQLLENQKTQNKTLIKFLQEQKFQLFAKQKAFQLYDKQ